MSVLLLPDGGFPLNPPEWISNLRTQALPLNLAAGDKEGRPDREKLDAVQGYPLLRTDQNGWIELTTDGERMSVEVERRSESSHLSELLFPS